MNMPIQLKINLSPELHELLQLKASRLGVPLTQYVKHVLMKDVEKEEYPTFKMPKKTEEEMNEAIKHIDEAVDADVFFKQLKNER